MTSPERVARMAVLIAGGLMAIMLSLGLSANGQQELDVLKNVNQGLVPFPATGKGGVSWLWKPLTECSRKELLEARRRFESRLHENAKDLFGTTSNRIILRHLNRAIPPNKDKSKAFQIRTVCVFPYEVDMTWRDANGKNHRYVVGEAKLSEWQDLIQQQMKSFSDRLFETSKGKLWLDFRVLRYGTLRKLTPGKKGYWLSPSPAGAWVREPLAKHEVLYIFFVPKLNGHDRPPMPRATYCTKSGRFRHRYITVYTTTGRLKRADGWVRWDLGIPHELWHFFRDVLPAYCDYKGWLPNDDNMEHRKVLKKECKDQGLPIEYAHEDQYSTFVTWQSVAALRKAFGVTYEW